MLDCPGELTRTQLDTVNLAYAYRSHLDRRLQAKALTEVGVDLARDRETVLGRAASLRRSSF